jgi:hypothetical protein
MNGLTQVIVLAWEASAVALALMLTVGTPKTRPKIVGIAFERAALR